MRVINHLTMFSGNQLADIFCVILKQLLVAEQNLRTFLRRGLPPGRECSGCGGHRVRNCGLARQAYLQCDFTRSGIENVLSPATVRDFPAINVVSQIRRICADKGVRGVHAGLLQLH